MINLGAVRRRRGPQVLAFKKARSGVIRGVAITDTFVLNTLSFLAIAHDFRYTAS